MNNTERQTVWTNSQNNSSKAKKLIFSTHSISVNYGITFVIDTFAYFHVTLGAALNPSWLKLVSGYLSPQLHIFESGVISSKWESSSTRVQYVAWPSSATLHTIATPHLTQLVLDWNVYHLFDAVSLHIKVSLGSSQSSALKWRSNSVNSYGFTVDHAHLWMLYSRWQYVCCGY